MIPIRETLFGDLPLNRWPDGDGPDSVPWSDFVSARTQLAAGRAENAMRSWREILAKPGLESRHYLQAWHFLRQNGQHAPKDIAKELLGVIVEVSLPRGLDIVVAYADHSARYYNFSGAGVVWEHADDSLDSFIDDLLTASRTVVARIGPWKEDRPPAPPTGCVRLSFLTPSGLHFGQGPMDGFSQDALAGPVIQSAIQLMQALMKK
jgi:hypothetical protein